MKTLDQIAEVAGVTKAAIYKRFQSYGLSVNELKAEKQGRTKVYGDDIEALIILMFQPMQKVESSVENTCLELEVKTKEFQGIIQRLEVEKNATKAEKEKAEERAEIAETRAERAEAQIEILLRQIDKLTDAIRAAEAVQAAQMARFAMIPAPADNKQGVLVRLWNRMKAGKSGNTASEDEDIERHE